MKEQNQNINNAHHVQLSELSKDFQAIITGIFPNTKYFDSRFDLLQVQIDELRRGQETLKNDMDFRFGQVDKGFEQVDKRFEQVDKRFEQVDKRFEQVDKKIDDVKKDMNKRFEQVIASIDRLSDKLDNRDKEQRDFTLKMFSISIIISIFGALGAFLKTMGVF